MFNQIRLWGNKKRAEYYLRQLEDFKFCYSNYYIEKNEEARLDLYILRCKMLNALKKVDNETRERLSNAIQEMWEYLE